MNDLGLQIAQHRERAGLSQKQLAAMLKTSQQHISRLESPNYEGHSLRMLRRLAAVLHVGVRVMFEPEHDSASQSSPAPKARARKALESPADEDESLPVSLL